MDYTRDTPPLSGHIFSRNYGRHESAMTKSASLHRLDDQKLTIFSDLPASKPGLEVGPYNNDVIIPRDVTTPPIKIEDTTKGNELRRGSLSGYLHRKMTGLQQKFFSGHEPPGLNPKSKYLLGSCPNLVIGSNTASPKPKPKVRHCRSSDGRDLKTAPSPDGSCENLVSMDKSARTSLTVPDIFVTSKTHSKIVANEDLRVQSSSSPNLGDSRRHSQIKRQSEFKKAQSLSLFIAGWEGTASKELYRGANISQVLDFLFLGSIESIYNEHILCRLGVERVVDLSNKRPGDVPSKKKSICPCSCPSKTVHSRAKLCIHVEDSDVEGIDVYFREINIFLEGARKAKKNVLVASYLGQSRAATVIIQYLMGFHGMDLRTAYNLVKSRRQCIKINPGFQVILEKLEEQCKPGQVKSMQFRHLVGNQLARKTAWTEA